MNSVFGRGLYFDRTQFSADNILSLVPRLSKLNVVLSHDLMLICDMKRVSEA